MIGRGRADRLEEGLDPSMLPLPGCHEGFGHSRSLPILRRTPYVAICHPLPDLGPPDHHAHDRHYRRVAPGRPNLSTGRDDR